MFGTILEEGKTRRNLALVTVAARTPWQELADRAQACRRTLAELQGRRVGLRFRASTSCFAGLAALDWLRCDVFLLPDEQPFSDSVRLAEELRLGAVVGMADGGDAQGLGVHELAGEDRGSGESTV